MKLNVNSDQSKAFTKKLKSLHKRAFPVAVRQTLNDAGMELKQTTMPKSAKKSFTEREKNFFKANSRVNFAEGFDVNSMRSEVGFTSEKLRSNSTNYSVKDLDLQEHGGVIKKRSFIPLKSARVAGNANKVVRANARLSKLKTAQVIKTSKIGKTRTGNTMIVKTAKQRFIRAAIMAKKLNGKDAYVLGNKARGSRTLSLINSLKINSKLGTIKINRTPLYSVKKGRVVKVGATQFMKRASFETSMNMNKMYIKRAQERFKKHGILK